MYLSETRRALIEDIISLDERLKAEGVELDRVLGIRVHNVVNKPMSKVACSNMFLDKIKGMMLELL